MRAKIASPEITYIRKMFAQETQLLTEISAELKSRNRPINVGAEEGKMLQVFLYMINAQKVLEIGTLGGYSALWMAAALPKDGKLITIEKDPEYAALSNGYFTRSNLSKNIELHEGDALKILPEITPSFDAIFIDANKNSYCDYLDHAERLVRKGGLIIGDNTFLFGSVYASEPPSGISAKTWAVMREFNKRLANPLRYHSILIPTAEGMTVAQKRF